jgi:hypothetical protein
MQKAHYLPNWATEALTDSLKTIFSDQVSDKSSDIQHHQSTPIKNQRQAKISTDFIEKLKLLVDEDQEQLGHVNQDKFIPFLTEDPREYQFDSGLPVDIYQLLSYFYWRMRIPPDCNCSILIGRFGRQAKTLINPPKTEVACRIILHLGPDEVYSFTEVSSSGKRGISKPVTVPNGSYFIMDKSEATSHNIFVSSNRNVEFPLPDNCDEMIQQGLSAVGSGNQFGKGAKMPSPEQVKKMMEKSGVVRKTIRLKNYQRLTIILDFGPSALTEETKILEIARFGNGAGPPPPGPSNGSWNGKLHTDIPTGISEGIASILPPGINPSILGKVAGDKKLSGYVTDVARGVASDLEGREELNSSSPMITSGLVEAIACSAVKRISPEKVSKIGKNIEALQSDGPSTSKSRRTQRRKARRAAVRRNVLETGGENIQIPSIGDFQVESSISSESTSTEDNSSETAEILARMTISE